MTASAIAQIIMVATLLLMITGKTPIYITAITGATIAALVAGFPIAGSADMTIAKMVISGLNPVIADMTGILLFIGIMQATGFMDVIIRDIVRVGNKLGGGTGVYRGRYCRRRDRCSDRFYAACDHGRDYRPGSGASRCGSQ